MRAKGFVVTLVDDLKDEDVDFMKNVLYSIKGVIRVDPVEGDIGADYLTEGRIRRKLAEGLFDLANDIDKL